MVRIAQSIARLREQFNRSTHAHLRFSLAAISIPDDCKATTGVEMKDQTFNHPLNPGLSVSTTPPWGTGLYNPNVPYVPFFPINISEAGNFEVDI
jgi:hypothetical protein